MHLFLPVDGIPNAAQSVALTFIAQERLLTFEARISYTIPAWLSATSAVCKRTDVSHLSIKASLHTRYRLNRYLSGFDISPCFNDDVTIVLTYTL